MTEQFESTLSPEEAYVGFLSNIQQILQESTKLKQSQVWLSIFSGSIIREDIHYSDAAHIADMGLKEYNKRFPEEK